MAVGSFATDDASHNVTLAMRYVQQLHNEGERDYYLRLSDASNRCGNVHNAQELVTLYIDGLDRRIKEVVTHYRRTHKDATFLQIMEYAGIQGIAVRAGTQALRKVSIDARQAKPSLSKTVQARPSKLRIVALVDSPSESRLSTIEYDARGNEHHVNLLNRESEEDSEETKGAAQTTSYDQTSYDLSPAFSERSHVPAPRIPYADRHTKFNLPGWGGGRRASPSPARSPGRIDDARRRNFTCDVCYEHGHISPDCNLPLRATATFIQNYENLTLQEKATVPNNSYLRVSAMMRHEPPIAPERARFIPSHAPAESPVQLMNSSPAVTAKLTLARITSKMSPPTGRLFVQIMLNLSPGFRNPAPLL